LIALFGGAFDPPHNGHVELLRTAQRLFELPEALVLVAKTPAHKQIKTPVERRLELARAAFPLERVVLDEQPRTVDTLRAHPEWEGATFLLGADEFADLRRWKEPDELLRLVRLAVAARPGYPRERLDAILAELSAPERVSFFELEPMPIASRELRARLDRGEDVHEFVPGPVWDLIERAGLYGRGYTADG
jgi:nicotinate-nucleotide adenylyltransferase